MTEVAVPQARFGTVEWWDQQAATADVVDGSALITGDAADKLINVPMLITRVIYRDGIQRHGIHYRNDYVSCEAVVAPAEVLQKKATRGRLDMNLISVEPGESIVFNDGSTGIYRQITAYLEMKGLIKLPDPLVESGPMGDCSYDLPRSQWKSGADAATAGIILNPPLLCPRGLRYSEYSNDYAPDGAKTRYIG